MTRQEFAFTLTTPAGSHRLALTLDASQMSQRIMLEELAAGRLYESETSNFISSVLRPGDTFIDIGAHVGYFSMLASAFVGQTGRVFSFEPEARNFSHLLDHIELNNALNVIPLHMAAGASPGIAEFFVNADNDGGHALWEVGRHPFNERSRQTPTTARVYVSSLDQIFETVNPGQLRAMKIDAEGAEFAILVGARRLIANHRIPFIIAEINRFGLESMGASEQMLRGLMRDLGYETWLFQPGQTFIQRLEPEQTPDTNYVFNVLFRHPEAAARAA
ncbi:MAG: FkbM family methyltransferase [Gemmatimonadota bacterium]